MRRKRKKKNKKTIGIKRTLKRMGLKKTVECFRAAGPDRTKTNLTVTRAIKMKKSAVMMARSRSRETSKKT